MEGAEKSMKEIADSLHNLLRKLGEFFDIFDLSFIVAGAVGLSAVLPWATEIEIPVTLPETGWLRGAAIIVGCYVAGLLCFAFGRYLRATVFPSIRLAVGWALSRSKSLDTKNFVKRLRLDNLERFENVIRNSANAHGFGDDYFVQRYLREKHGGWWLYIRLWAELRQREGLSSSLSFLNRSWVLTATFDGVAAALLLWAMSLLLRFLSPTGAQADYRLLCATAVFATISFICSREAQRYAYNQAEEIMATLAASRKIMKDVDQ